MIKALDLSEQYFRQIAEPALKTELPEIYEAAAAGLVGNGSECFGYDDELSQDHDWGADFYLWLPDSHEAAIAKISAWKERLYAEKPPANPRIQSAYGACIGAMTCGQFYRQLIGTPDGRLDLLNWLRIPEANLAMCVNGRVFLDGPGVFTEIRNRLSAYYPEDIRKKKIAAKCMAIAQTGQYNLERTAKRGDWVTANTVLTMFCQQVIALTFLLNRVYRPYYKWEYRMMCTLPVLGEAVGSLLSQLIAVGSGHIAEQAHTAAQLHATEQKHAGGRELISKICELLRGELLRQGLSQGQGWFLADHGEFIQSTIEDERLRRLPAQFE